MISLELLLEQRPGQEPLLPFQAAGGEVTALMVRTAVVVCGDERTLVRLDCLIVDPDALQWRSDTGVRRTENGQPDPHNGARLRGRVAQQVLRSGKKINRAFVGAASSPLNEAERAEVRDRSDQRALADQAGHEAMTVARAKRPRKPTPRKKTEDLERFSWKDTLELRKRGVSRCSCCKEIKPLDQFYKRTNRKTGYCKPCCQIYQRAYRARPRVAA